MPAQRLEVALHVAAALAIKRLRWQEDRLLKKAVKGIDTLILIVSRRLYCYVLLQLRDIYLLYQILRGFEEPCLHIGKQLKVVPLSLKNLEQEVLRVPI